MWLNDEPRCPKCGHTGTIVEAKNGTFWVECLTAVHSPSQCVIIGFHDARRGPFADYDRQWGDFKTKEEAIQAWRKFCESTPMTLHAIAEIERQKNYVPPPEGYQPPGSPFPF